MMSEPGDGSEKLYDENGFEVPLHGEGKSAERGPGSPRPGRPTGEGAERRCSRAGMRGGTGERQKETVCGDAAEVGTSAPVIIDS